MKTLFPLLTLAGTVLVTTSLHAADFSNDFVNEKISRHWELDTLEITQRIDVKKRREMKQKSVEVSENDVTSFEVKLKKLMQQSGDNTINEADITDILSSFAQPGNDMQVLSVEVEGDDASGFPAPDELMLTDIADYDATMMIEESLILKADGSVFYEDDQTDNDANQSNNAEQTMAAAANWRFDTEKQQLIVTEQQDNLSISAAYKLVELTDKRMVLEEKQHDSSVRMIFSSR